jgi:hypothetical protein
MIENADRSRCSTWCQESVFHPFYGVSPDATQMPDRRSAIYHSQLDDANDYGAIFRIPTWPSLFSEDIPPPDLKRLINKTYMATVYRHARRDADPRDIAPLR